MRGVPTLTPAERSFWIISGELVFGPVGRERVRAEVSRGGSGLRECRLDTTSANDVPMVAMIEVCGCTRSVSRGAS